MKRFTASHLLAVLLVVNAVAWTGAFAQDPTGPLDTPEISTVQVISSGLWTMHTSDTEIWFTPPDLFKPEWSDVAFEVVVEFCRAMNLHKYTKADGTPGEYWDPYGTVDDADGAALAEVLFTGQMMTYPWQVSVPKDDVGVPTTTLERAFLRVVLKNLDTKNNQLTDAEWMDPKKRLGVMMTASGYVDLPEGPEIFRMVDSSFYIFSRKGVVTVLAEDDYYMWTMRGDTSLEWPRDQDPRDQVDPGEDPVVGE